MTTGQLSANYSDNSTTDNEENTSSSRATAPISLSGSPMVDRQLVAENPVDAERTGDVCAGGCAVEQGAVPVEQRAGGGPRRQHRR
jgi:hypothetical protein